MHLHPPVRMTTLANVGPGEIIRLKWQNSVRYALTAEWPESPPPIRWLFLFPSQADPMPICFKSGGFAGDKAVLSFGRDFVVTYDPMKGPTLPEDAGLRELGLFISPKGLMLKAATVRQTGAAPWNPLEVLLETGLVPDGDNRFPLGLISEWSIGLPGLNGGPATTLLSSPPEAAP